MKHEGKSVRGRMRCHYHSIQTMRSFAPCVRTTMRAADSDRMMHTRKDQSSRVNWLWTHSSELRVMRFPHCLTKSNSFSYCSNNFNLRPLKFSNQMPYLVAQSPIKKTEVMKRSILPNTFFCNFFPVRHYLNL